MSETDQIMKRVGMAILLAPLIIGLPVALFAKGIDVQVFLAVASLWLVVALILILGPNSIMEVSFGSASIKRDVRAAQEARIETEAIRDNLTKVAKLLVENSFILASGSDLALHQHGSIDRVMKNLDEISKLVEVDPEKLAAWQEELRSVMREPLRLSPTMAP